MNNQEASMDITIPPGETATIHLPGATAIRIDAGQRVIAVDTTSMVTAGNGDLAAANAVADAPLAPEWLVEDLRASAAYGDFHQLKPVGECFDSTCPGRSEHATAEDRAALRDRITS